MKNDMSRARRFFFTSKCFWKDIGIFVLRAINESYKQLQSSNPNKLRTITWIPNAENAYHFF